MAASLKPSLISHNHQILNKVLDAADFMCACFSCVSPARSSHRDMVTGLNLLKTVGLTVSLHIFGGHTAWWRGRVRVHYLSPSEFLGFPSVCLYVCVCTIECLSIACSCVAKQPGVCTLEWGWERREAPGQQRQTLTSTAASDWTHQCSWWMRLTIIILTWIVSLKVHSLTPQKVKSIFSVRNILLLLHTAKKSRGFWSTI